MVGRCGVFEITAGRQDRGVERRGIDPAAGKEDHALLDGADAKRLDALDFGPASEDQLGRAAADIEHQAPFARHAERVSYAHVDQPAFFFARNNLDRITDRLFGRRQEYGDVPGDAQSIGRDDLDRSERITGQQCLETRQRFERGLHRLFGQAALAVEPGRQPDRIARSLYDAHRFAVVHADVQAKTIGA